MPKVNKEKVTRLIIPLLLLVVVIVGAIAAFLTTTNLDGLDDVPKEQNVSFLKPSAPIEQVLTARQYIDSSIESISLPERSEAHSEYVLAAFKAVDYYKAVADSPLPYEVYAPDKTSDMIPEVVYRGDEQLTLTGSEEELVFKAKRSRVDLYTLAVEELNRRVALNGESPYLSEEARLQELAEELPFYVPIIRVGNACDKESFETDNVLGCFFNSDEILVTPLALKLDEGDGCLLLSVIAHETRHYQQFKERAITDFVSKVVEDDANEFMRNNTPSRCK